MKTLIRTILRSFSSEPAPWLLASSALLAALLWHLPVPPFIFAQAGGSTSATPCTCAVDNCKPWALNGQPECHIPPWEECKADMEQMADCPPPLPPEKKMPKSRFTYERQLPGEAPAGYCENTDAHSPEWQDRNNPPPPGYEDEVKWKRDDVSVTANGDSGTKTIEFKPKLKVNFSGFEDGNVCEGSVGQIDIKSSLFASMSVCGSSDIVDTTKSSGWAYVTHTFKKDGTWKFTAGANPHTETFGIKKEGCACNNAQDDPDEFITFMARVDVNGGVMFGSGQTPAHVLYYCDDDTTSCTPVNP